MSRLRWRDDGRIEYELKRRAPDGSTTLVCDPVEFLRKLTALIPPPRSHLTRYHGVFAAHHEWRNQIVPAARRDGQTTDNKAPDAAEAWGKPSADGAGEPPCSAAQQPDGSVLARYLDWAALLLRVFAVDVTQCPRCGSSLRILGVITQPDVIEGILHHQEGTARRVPGLGGRAMRSAAAHDVGGAAPTTERVRDTKAKPTSFPTPPATLPLVHQAVEMQMLHLSGSVPTDG